MRNASRAARRKMEPVMAKVKIPILIMLCLTGFSLSAEAAPVCLRQQDITSTTSPDGKELVVTMRDGTVWVNKLQTPCPNLKFDGFSWVLHQPALICEDSHSLKVLNSGETCTLGKFSRQPPGHP